MLRRVLDLLSLRDARSKNIGRRIYSLTLVVTVAGLCLSVAAAIILGDVVNLSMTLSDATNITQAPTSTCPPASAPLFSLLTTNFISPLPLFVVFVVLTRHCALLRGIKQRSLQYSTGAIMEFHET
jgi:hypothetical protein